MNGLSGMHLNDINVMERITLNTYGLIVISVIKEMNGVNAMNAMNGMIGMNGRNTMNGMNGMDGTSGLNGINGWSSTCLHIVCLCMCCETPREKRS